MLTNLSANWVFLQRQQSKKHNYFRTPLERRKLTISSESYGTFEGEWSSVQSSIAEDRVLAVECSNHAKLCREFDIVSFPAIRLHQKEGTFERYRGLRKAKEYGTTQCELLACNRTNMNARIQAYLQRMERPPISVVDENNITSFASTDDLAFIAQFSDEDVALEDRYIDMAYQYRDRHSFAIGPEASQSSSLQCINNANQEQFSTTALSNPTAIETFIKQCARPLVPELTRRNEAEYMRVSLGPKIYKTNAVGSQIGCSNHTITMSRSARASCTTSCPPTRSVTHTWPISSPSRRSSRTTSSSQPQTSPSTLRCRLSWATRLPRQRCWQ